MWDWIMSQFYGYLYFIIGLLSIIALIIFCCYGKRSKKRVSFDWRNVLASVYSAKKPIRKKHEMRCRRILEDLFRAPFTTIRPDFLKYTTGRNLELDGYNEELNLAFEYQGIQHRKYTPLFHSSYSDFEDQLRRDAFKKRVCEEKGLDVLYIPDTVHYNDLEEYIHKWYKNEFLPSRG